MTDIKVLSDREHILLRPNMYIGSISKGKYKEYILQNDKIEYKEIEYIPGLIKIINEIIDNSVDAAIKSDFKYGTLIKVNIDDYEVKVQDNGPGIPVQKNKDGHYLPELCWNHARAGSNFDKKRKAQIGMNGVGSYITVCFSKEFIGETCDGKNKFIIKILDNGSENIVNTNIKKCSTNGTIVKFKPNLERFNIDKIDEIHKFIIYQRLLNLSLSFPDITFKFNNRTIKLPTFKKYLEYYNSSFEIYETDKYKIGILPNNTDDFKHFSYVNGLRIPDGGTHIDYIVNNIVKGLRDKLIKKYKTIKPGDIKNKLQVVIFIRDFSNLMFNSQSKEKITNSVKDIQSYFGDIPFDKLIKKILRNKDIIDNIIEIYKIKEELNKRKMLKTLDRKKKIKNEKLIPATKENINLWITEGDSAQLKAASTFSRNENAFFSMFGVPLNAYDASLQSIIKSKKMIDLKDIIGFKFSENVQDELNYKNFIIMSDFDLAGHFIAGQLLGLFWRFAKNVIEEGRLKRFITPLIIGTQNNKIKVWFYTFEEYQKFMETDDAKKYNYEYKKGLGSWDQDEMKFIIDNDGLEKMLEVFEPDETAGDYIDKWLNGEKADERKKMLEGYEFNIMNV